MYNVAKQKFLALLSNKYFYFIIFLILLKPASFNFISPILDIASNVLRVFAGLVLVLLFIINKKLSKITISIVAYEAVIGIATVINYRNADFKAYVLGCVSILTMIIAVELGINNNVKIMLVSLMRVLELLVFANFITILVYPNGMYTSTYKANWLLGYDNCHILTILPLLCISLIVFTFQNNYFELILSLIISCVTIIIRWPATSLVGMFIFLFFALLPLFRNKTNFFNVLSYSVTSIIIFLIIVIFRLQEYFSFIIVNILHKNLTFTGITRIWDRVLDLIQKCPIIGYGKMSGIGIMEGNHEITHAHSYILQVLYMCGAIGLIAFFIVNFFACNELFKHKNSYIAKIISGTLFSFYMMFVAEAFNSPLIFVLFVLAYYVDKIEQECNDQNLDYKHKIKLMNFKKSIVRIKNNMLEMVKK